jgi:hypothetical protein
VARIAYTAELLSRAQAWLSLPLTDKRYEAGLQELTELYRLITGEPASSCRQCQYSDWAATVVAYVREASTFLFPETMSESKYTVANGYEHEQFVHEDYNKVVTAENLTDADAKFFIGKGFGHAIKLKAGENPDGSTGEVDTKPTKDELKARYAELYGQDAPKKHNVAQLTADIATKEGEIALGQARADYETAFGQAAEDGLSLEKLTELTAAKLAETQGSAA